MAEPGMIAVPAVDWIWTVSAKAILHDLESPEGTVLQIDTAFSSIDGKRNHFVHEFLKHSDLQWLCFVDSDMVPPPDAIFRLLDRGKDVISGCCLRRVPPYSAAFGKRTAPGNGPDARHWYSAEEVAAFSAQDDPVIEVEFCGTAFLLIQRSVLSDMAFPWFKCFEDYPGSGEDIHFCDRLRKGKLAVYVDTSVPIGHTSVLPIETHNACRLNDGR